MQKYAKTSNRARVCPTFFQKKLFFHHFHPFLTGTDGKTNASKLPPTPSSCSIRGGPQDRHRQPLSLQCFPFFLDVHPGFPTCTSRFSYMYIQVFLHVHPGFSTCTSRFFYMYIQEKLHVHAGNLRPAGWVRLEDMISSQPVEDHRIQPTA